jgi:thioesterase domain-containing protein
LAGLHAGAQVALLHERLVATGMMPARTTPEDLAAQWAPWAPRMTPWTGPGDHLSILQPPHVAQLAHRISTLALSGRSHPPGEHQAGGSRRQAVPHGK